MKYLVIGSGGREHAIAWKLAQSDKCTKVYVSPGNGGTETEEKCTNVEFDTWDEMSEFCLNEEIKLVVVGPEDPLVNGLADKLIDKGIRVVGADKKAAALEGSKIFAKEFMFKYGVRTAGYKKFEVFQEAADFCKETSYPLVIKADGLAQGKGVSICKNSEDAEKALSQCMIEEKFNEAGKNVLVEEHLSGFEASIIGIFDGERITPLISCMDHKKIGEGETGPNTGGMGVIAPNPFITEKIMKDFEENIMNPTHNGLKEEGMNFVGFIFFGVMIREEKCYLLEYNMRLGDPETQAILRLIDGDFGEVLDKAITGNLTEEDINWKDEHCCGVILSSQGYPGKYEKGFEIKEKKHEDDVKGFYAGAKVRQGCLETSGGRVICVTATGFDRSEAVSNAYKGINNFSFNGMYYRNDIGRL